MTTQTNSAEGGSNGTQVSQANSGGTSGTAFDSVTIGSGATFNFSSTQAAHGSLSYTFATGATAANTFGQWNVTPSGTQVWFRMYLYFTANPSTGYRLLTVGTGTSTVNGSVVINTNGTLKWNNSSGSTILTTTASIPLNAWFRIEGFLIASSTVGQVELKLFTTSADAVTADETDTSAATQNTAGTAPNKLEYGVSGATVANVVAWFADDLGYSDAGYLGPAVTAVTWVPQRYGQPAPLSLVPWQQGDRRDANTVATVANPLVPPLDTTWQANGPYSHLYEDAFLEQARRVYFYQRSYVSDPSFYPPFTTPATPLDTTWQADAAYHHLYNDSHLRDRRAYFYQRPYVSDPSLLTGPADPLQLNPEQSSSSDAWRVAIVPAFYDRRLVPQQRSYYDVSLLATAQLENELLGGAQTPRTYAMPVTHKDRWWMPEQPARPADPLLIQTAQLENELLGGAQTVAHYGTSVYIDRRLVPQQRAYTSDPLLLTTAQLENELLGGAETWLHYGTSAYIDRRLAPQQRLYISDPSFYPPVNPADPVQVAWLPTWLEHNTAATNAPRWWMPQQPSRISDPTFYLPATDPLMVAWGAGGNYWHLYNRGADATDRRLVSQQRTYESDPLLLGTALLENELLGGAETWPHYASVYIDRREVPQQRAYISDPSFYVGATDPLTVTWGAGGGYWHLYNRASDATDRRLMPQQRGYYDVSLLTTALLENELLGGAQTPRTYGTPATHYDRRLMPQQRAYYDVSLLTTALLENELLGGAVTPLRYRTPATHYDRRLVPQQRRYISDPAFYPLPPATVPGGGPNTVTGPAISASVTGPAPGHAVTDPRDAGHTVSGPAPGRTVTDPRDGTRSVT